jgi:hypothetical protein
MREAIDFKYYDNTAEEVDSFAQRDPRPLESLESVINPGFDEDGTILNHPLPPQHPRLLQSDRQISESAYVKSSKIMYPHPDIASLPKHLTVSYISAKAKCSADEARIIADECISLNATKKMVDKFCSWAKLKSVEKLINYLLPFTEAVVDVETPGNEVEPWEENPVEAGRPLWGSYIDNIRGFNGICTDIPVETIEHKPEPGLAKVVNSEIIWPNSSLDFIEIEDDWDTTEQELAEQEPEGRNPNNGSTVSYHVLENMGLKQEKIAILTDLYSWEFIRDLANKPLDFVEDLWNKKFSWEARQPKWFKQQLEVIHDCKDLEQLSELGKTTHSKNSFNQDQAGVFWTTYNSQKVKLAPKHYSLSCRSMLAKIIRGDGHLGAVGVWLHNVQIGKIKVVPPPTDFEWGIIWSKYKEVKEAHA